MRSGAPRQCFGGLSCGLGSRYTKERLVSNLARSELEHKHFFNGEVRTSPRVARGAEGGCASPST